MSVAGGLAIFFSLRDASASFDKPNSFSNKNFFASNTRESNFERAELERKTFDCNIKIGLKTRPTMASANNTSIKVNPAFSFLKAIIYFKLRIKRIEH